MNKFNYIIRLINECVFWMTLNGFIIFCIAMLGQLINKGCIGIDSSKAIMIIIGAGIIFGFRNYVKDGTEVKT